VGKLFILAFSHAIAGIAVIADIAVIGKNQVLRPLL
jgi:hypothetical protein